MSLDDILRWFFVSFLGGIIGLLQKAAFIAVFLGLLGYFLGSVKEFGLPTITISPISDKSFNRMTGGAEQPPQTPATK